MYFGWIIVAIATLVYVLGIGATFSSFGLFVIPVSEEYRLSRANMNSAMILMNVGSAVIAPFMGRMLDRFSAKRIMMVCALLFGASLAGLGLSRSLWVSAFILALPLPAALLGVATLTMTVLLARWFVAQRGRAMVLAAMGMSLAAIIMSPIVAWLIEHQGWRGALVTVGVAATAILLALAAFVRERPGPGDIESVKAPSGAASTMAAHVSSTPLPVRTLLMMPQFWLIGLGVSMVMGVSQGVSISLVPLALGDGLTMVQAASLISVTGGAAIGSKLLLSIFADRVERILLLTGMFLLGAVMNVMFLMSSGYPMLVGGAILLGMASGCVAPLFYALLADRFGQASFGTVRGLMMPVSAIFGAVGIRLAGEVYDRTGGYAALFMIFVGCQLVGAILIFAIRFTRADRAKAALARA